jgi:beta-galactosidase beta subunit
MGLPTHFLFKKEEDMDDRTKADKDWQARQEAARYRIFNAATNAAEAADDANDETYFAVLDQAGQAAEAAAAEATGHKTYVELLEALDARRKQS